jgi:hypothetical protein
VADLRFDPTGLRRSAHTSEAAADRAASASEILAATPVSAAPFGDLPKSAELATALAEARSLLAATAQSAGTEEDEGGHGANRAAEFGEHLVTEATNVVGSAARAIADHML